jgi:hypothetical protein
MNYWRLFRRNFWDGFGNGVGFVAAVELAFWLFHHRWFH